MGMAEPTDSDSVALDKLVAALYQLNADLSVPSPKDYGSDETAWFGSLELMAGQALASGSPDNNLLIPTLDDIIELYRRVWHQ